MKPISDARTCKDGCTYLRERLYEGAFFRKRLLERMQCFAGADAMLCGGGCNALRPRWAKPILWRTAFQAAVSGVSISWHTSSVGVPGYSW